MEKVYYLITYKDGTSKITTEDIPWDDLQVGETKLKLVDYNSFETIQSQNKELKSIVRELSTKLKITTRNWLDSDYNLTKFMRYMK